MAENQEMIKKLIALAQLDIDAVYAYTSAIDRIDLPEVKQKLSLFRGDHETHISDLFPIIERLGGELPRRAPDMKGYLIQSFTAVRAMISNESAIRAMKANEELTNRVYDEALKLDFPENIRSVVVKNRDDERRHLEYIVQCIGERVWEKKAA